MTLETMAAVVDELVKRSVPATFEYPGFIKVSLNLLPGSICYGDQDETFYGQVMDEDMCEVLESLESSIPAGSEDVRRVADHIACDYSQACEVGNAC